MTTHTPESASFTTLVHLNSEDFLRFLAERAAIQTLSLALGCADDSDSVLSAVKRLMQERDTLAKANAAWAGLPVMDVAGERA